MINAFKDLLQNIFKLAIICLGVFGSCSANYHITSWAYSSTAEKLGSFLGFLAGALGFLLLGTPAAILILGGVIRAIEEEEKGKAPTAEKSKSSVN